MPSPRTRTAKLEASRSTGERCTIRHCGGTIIYEADDQGGRYYCTLCNRSPLPVDPDAIADAEQRREKGERMIETKRAAIASLIRNEPEA